MAGGGIVADSGGKHYDSHVTAYVIITCIVAATGGLMFGYDIGISGMFMTSKNLVWFSHKLWNQHINCMFCLCMMQEG